MWWLLPCPSLPQFPHQGGRPETPPISHSLTERAHCGLGPGHAEHPAPCSTSGVPGHCSWPILVPLNQGQSDLNSESERLPGLIREYLQPLCSQLDSQVTAAAGDPDTGVKVAGGGVGGGRGAATSWGQQLDTAWPGNLPAWHPSEAHQVAYGDPLADAMGVLVPAFSSATVGLPVQHQGAPSSAQSRVSQPSVTLHPQLSQHRVPPVQPSMQQPRASPYTACSTPVKPSTPSQFSPAWPCLSPVHDTPFPARVHSTPRAPSLHTGPPPLPAEHPLSPVPCWEAAVPGPVGSHAALERASHGRGHSRVVLAAHVLTRRETRPGRQVLAAHACATTLVPRTSPGSHLGPGAGSGPGCSLLEAVSSLFPKATRAW